MSRHPVRTCGAEPEASLNGVPRTLKEESCRKAHHIGGAVREMEACWPSSVGLRGRALNRPDAALAEDRRGERSGKRPGLTRAGGDQEGVPEHPSLRFGVGVVVEASKGHRWHRNRGSSFCSRDEPGGCPSIGQVVPGVKAARAWSAALARNVGKRTSILRSGS